METWVCIVETKFGSTRVTPGNKATILNRSEHRGLKYVTIKYLGEELEIFEESLHRYFAIINNDG